MAEVYCLVSGHHRHHEKWASDLSCKWLPVWKDGKIEKDKTGATVYREILVAPIQLYKVCTEKENIPELMNLLGSGDYVLKRYKWIDKTVKLLRKFIGLKPVPKPKNPNPFMQSNQINKAVAVIPIGIKPDKVHKGREQI